MKATIYIAYHKPTPLLKSRSVRPIHVGRATHPGILDDIIGDDTGDNISIRNGRYCELTAVYWAWKNDTESTHIGLMHYSRVLDFAGIYSEPVTEIFLDRFVPENYLSITEKWLADNPDVDAVLPIHHNMGKSVRENYEIGHRAQDLSRARDEIAKLYPEYIPSFDTVSRKYNILLGNMFLLRREIFFSYCEWLFSILNAVDNKNSDSKYHDPYQYRNIGFLAERLFTVFMHKISQEKTANIKYVHIMNVKSSTFIPYRDDLDFNSPENVNIALSSDDRYAPHTAAMLRSLMEHADKNRTYNFFFLHSDVPDIRRELLQSVLSDYSNMSWHEINVGHAFARHYRSRTRAPSNATYNRFLVFELFPKLKRLLYLDVDMIALGDIAEIFDFDIGDNQIAAVPDYIMTRTLTGRTPTRDPAVPDLYRYQRDVLKLNDQQIHRYFNAGVLLFNFENTDLKKAGDDLLTLAQTGKYLFRDQDILNLYFKDSYFKLPARYNVFNTTAEGYNRVPRDNHAEAMTAKKDPLIVHYAAGNFKPWLGVSVPFAQHYWSALERTPFFGEVMSGISHRRARRNLVDDIKGGIKESGRAIANKVPRLRPYLYRVYHVFTRLLGGR